MHHAITSDNFLIHESMVEILVVDIVKERLEFSRRKIVGTVEGGNVLAEGEFVLIPESRERESKTCLGEVLVGLGLVGFTFWRNMAILVSCPSYFLARSLKSYEMHRIAPCNSINAQQLRCFGIGKE
eukprot:scaffold4407_cov138-Skeletonema_menzelii.AAC.9